MQRRNTPHSSTDCVLTLGGAFVVKHIYDSQGQHTGKMSLTQIAAYGKARRAVKADEKILRFCDTVTSLLCVRSLPTP